MRTLSAGLVPTFLKVAEMVMFAPSKGKGLLRTRSPGEISMS
jgi:hypothetical protein